MRNQSDIEILEPTPVERALVNAMLTHHEQWPFIYLEMKGVCKEDLLMDAEYCNRHKHPSLTQFFRECGQIGGVNISQMRKYQRAGAFYELYAALSCELPPVTDERVCSLSPETFVFLQRIDELLAEGDPSNADVRSGLMQLLIGSLLEGEGLSRKQLKTWLMALRGYRNAGNLSEHVHSFLAEVDLEKMHSEQVFHLAVHGAEQTATVKALLQKGHWLNALGGDGSAQSGICVIEGAALPSDKACSVDFVVAENVSCDLAIHGLKMIGFDINSDAVVPSSCIAEGFDYSWLILPARPSADEDLYGLDDLDENIGVMTCRNECFEVIKPASLISRDSSESASLYKSLIQGLLLSPTYSIDRVEYRYMTV